MCDDFSKDLVLLLTDSALRLATSAERRRGSGVWILDTGHSGLADPRADIGDFYK